MPFESVQSRRDWEFACTEVEVGCPPEAGSSSSVAVPPEPGTRTAYVVPSGERTAASAWGASTAREDVAERETSTRLPVAGEGAAATAGASEGDVEPPAGAVVVLADVEGVGCAVGELDGVPAAPATSTWSLIPMVYCAPGRMDSRLAAASWGGAAPGVGSGAAGVVPAVVKAIVAGEDAWAPVVVTSALGAMVMR